MEISINWHTQSQGSKKNVQEGGSTSALPKLLGIKVVKSFNSPTVCSFTIRFVKADRKI